MTAPRKAPQDRKAKARKAEVTGAVRDASFEYHGRTYMVTSEAANDLELFEAVEDGKEMTAVRSVLGAEQWQAFKDDHRTDTGRVPLEPVEGFIHALMGALGLGNSAASRDS